MSNIFEIKNEYLHLMHMLEDSEEADDETIQEVIKDTLECIDGEFEEKADSYAYIIRQLEADEDTIKKEEQRLRARRESIARNRQRLRESLRDAMKATGKTKFKTAFNSFSVSAAGGVTPVILDCDPERLPEKFQKVKIEADMTAIRDQLKLLEVAEEGAEFPYAHFGTRSEVLRIR